MAMAQLPPPVCQLLVHVAQRLVRLACPLVVRPLLLPPLPQTYPGRPFGLLLRALLLSLTRVFQPFLHLHPWGVQLPQYNRRVLLLARLPQTLFRLMTLRLVPMTNLEYESRLGLLPQHLLPTVLWAVLLTQLVTALLKVRGHGFTTETAPPKGRLLLAVLPLLVRAP